MSCYHPLIAFARPSPYKVGKKELAFLSHEKDSGQTSYVKDGVLYSERLELPCGQCIGCRIDYSKQWALRCMLEAQQYKTNYFLTITYDNDHVPIRRHVKADSDTGEVVLDENVLTLQKRDLQLFVKRLRTNLKRDFDFEGVRFYCCGEYGSVTQRPHYHMILFNCFPLPDLKVYGKNKLGHFTFNSDFLDKCWKKGYIVVGSVTYESCAYVARYMMKKHKGKDFDFYALNGLDPEFCNCSRKPGIGRSWFEDHKTDLLRFDEIIFHDSNGKAKKFRSPRYYDRIFDVDDPDRIAEIKASRVEVAKASKEFALSKTSLSPNDYLALQEDNFLHKVKILPRSLSC